MDWPAFVRARLTTITDDPVLDADIIEELAQHLASRYDELLGDGASSLHALAILDAELDEQLAEQLREAARRAPRPLPVPPHAGSWWRDMGCDVAYAVRLLRRNPGFTGAALVTLALGIGVTAAVFSVVQSVLLRPSPFPAAERLAVVWEADRKSGTTHEPSSGPDFMDFERRSRQFERLGGFVSLDMSLAPRSGDAIRVSAIAATSGLMDLFGIRPVLGQLWSADDERRGSAPVALISDRLWRQYFDGRSDVIGRTVSIDGRPFSVRGVVPQDADFGVTQVLASADYARGFVDRDTRIRVDVWVPLPLESATRRESHGIHTIGRLASGATFQTAQREMARVAADLEREFPASNLDRGVFVEPLTEVVFGKSQSGLFLLLGAVALVLLIACVNVANLLMARGLSRVREVAVRTALGAAAPRLLRQFLVESLVLATASAVLGMVIAWVTLRLLLALAPPEVPRLATVGMDARVLVFALTVSTVVGIAFGIFPMIQVRRTSLQGTLSTSETRVTGGQRARFRSALVVAEVALAVVLVAGTGLLVRSFWRLSATDLGFDVSAIAKAEFQLPPARYPTDPAAAPAFARYLRFTTDLLDRAASLPGVEDAALTAYHPLDPGFSSSFQVVGREVESSGSSWPELPMRFVSPGYFRAMGIAIVGGRSLGDGDVGGAAPVVVANRAFVERFFPGSSAVGQKVRFWGAERTIVGIVGNEKFQGAAKEAPFAVYVPLAQVPLSTLALVVRTTDDSAVSTSLREVIRTLDPELAVFGIESIRETLDRSFANQRFLMTLIGAFAGLALVLSTVGIHGVLSYIVTQRTREIGVRIALGADSGHVVRLVAQQGFALTGLGLVIGVVLAVLASRWLSTFLFQTNVTDYLTMAGVVSVFALVAMGATCLPVVRAVGVDPVVAMRQE